MRVNQDWLKPIGEALTGPAIAVLFWFQLIITVTLTIAHGKFWEANFFEAFGAIGQVAFAGAVFWLTYQISERQRRLEIHDRRAIFIEKHGFWADKFLNVHAENSDARTLFSLAMRSKALFSKNVTAFYSELMEIYPEAVSTSGLERAKLISKAHLVSSKLQVQMIIEIDSGYSVVPALNFDVEDEGGNPETPEQSNKFAAAR